MWTAPGLTLIDQSASRITAQQVIRVLTHYMPVASLMQWLYVASRKLISDWSTTSWKADFWLILASWWKQYRRHGPLPKTSPSLAAAAAFLHDTGQEAERSLSAPWQPHQQPAYNHTCYGYRPCRFLVHGRLSLPSELTIQCSDCNVQYMTPHGPISCGFTLHLGWAARVVQCRHLIPVLNARAARA